MTEAVDPLFEEAAEALRQGERARARELLTRLIRADQKNVTYWIWMSAAVDTLKERVYCLETVLKLEPGNKIAQRGLMLMGARPPDRNVKPFPLSRTRAWEDKLFLANESQEIGGLQGLAANPVTQLIATVVTGGLLIGIVLLAGLSARAAMVRPGVPQAASATPTLSPTTTLAHATAMPSGTPSAPTPLAVLLGISYTATPVYVSTPRSPASAAVYQAAQDALARGNLEAYVERMLELQQVEPESADIQYQIAEQYLLGGQCSKALYYYNESLKVDDEFAPGYLGLARARLCSEPRANVVALYALAQESDPAYGEVYLDRASYHLNNDDIVLAIPDLERAARLMPRSALVQLGFARAYTLQGNAAKALAAAEKANSIDQTLLPVYYYLGRAYIDTADYEQAIRPLQIFLLYETTNGEAYALMGQALAETGNYRAAVEALNQALRLDRNQVTAFAYLGTSYLQLGNLAGAEVNFKRAIEYFPDSFEANIGLTQIYYDKGTFGSAYLQAETAISKAETNPERALAIYWRALANEGRASWVDAIKDWRALLDMPASAVTAEMRQEAQQHLRSISTPTSTPKPGAATPTPSLTPTQRPGSTATPARTFTPTP